MPESASPSMYPARPLRAELPRYRRFRAEDGPSKGAPSKIPAARSKTHRLANRLPLSTVDTWARRQRVQRLGVVPVEKMPLIPLQAAERRHGLGAAVQEIVDSKIAEVIAGERWRSATGRYWWGASVAATSDAAAPVEN